MNAFGVVDRAGIAPWILAWFGPALRAGRVGRSRPDPMASLESVRCTWTREACRRDARITDVALIGNPMHGATRLSSTTLPILGASFARPATIERGTEGVEPMKNLPFAACVSQEPLAPEGMVMALAAKKRTER